MEIGGYRAEELLGQGASASVYRAVSPAGKAVALKVFDGPYERALDAAKKEAALTAQVDHPHLARVVALLCDADQIALAVELGAAGSLADLLARRHQLTPPEVLTVIIPIASALATAHERGVVHGDLSPANIVFDAAGRPMLTDLGAARVAIECGLPVAATPGYVAPEVARGAVPDAAADVFSLGAVALHCLSGRPAWNADDLRDVVVQSTIGQWPDPDDADGPRAVLAAIRSALGDTPERRPGAASLVMELSRSGKPEPIDLSTPADVTDRTGDALKSAAGERASNAPNHPAPEQLAPRQHRHRAADSVEAVSQQRIRPIATRVRADTERPTSEPVVRRGHDRRWWFRTAAAVLALAVIGTLAIQAGLIWAGSGAKTGAAPRVTGTVQSHRIPGAHAECHIVGRAVIGNSANEPPRQHSPDRVAGAPDSAGDAPHAGGRDYTPIDGSSPPDVRPAPQRLSRRPADHCLDVGGAAPRRGAGRCPCPARHHQTEPGVRDRCRTVGRRCQNNQCPCQQRVSGGRRRPPHRRHQAADQCCRF